MSSPAGTVTPIGESIASSFCGSEGGLTPLATSPSGEGGFDGGFLSTTRGPALIQDHLRCVIMHGLLDTCQPHVSPYLHSFIITLKSYIFILHTFASPSFVSC